MQRRTLLKTTALVAVASMSIVGAAWAENPHLKIGFVGVTSGPAAAWGISNQRSMEARAAEFRAAYGDLVNKQMVVRKLVQTEVERFTGQFGMPTRTEVDSTARRMQELRREMRALQERLYALEAAPSAPKAAKPAVAKSKSIPSKAPAKKAAARRSR